MQDAFLKIEAYVCTTYLFLPPQNGFIVVLCYFLKKNIQRLTVARKIPCVLFVSDNRVKGHLVAYSLVFYS